MGIFGAIDNEGIFPGKKVTLLLCDEPDRHCRRNPEDTDVTGTVSVFQIEDTDVTGIAYSFRMEDTDVTGTDIINHKKRY